MSDERLARMVSRGNERAFVTLYERHSQPLYRYSRSIVGNDADAQDALQSAFAAALVALRRGARDAPLRPWLFRITHNEAVSLLRRRRPAVELTKSSEPVGPSAHERAVERERLSLLVGDLRELGNRQRGALVMRELSGLSHAEIALALGVSVGAAKQAVFEARRALLDLAEGRAMSCEQVRRMISDGDRRALRARRLRAHLRGCDGCASFAAAIPARRADLQALAPPLAPLAAAGILGGVLGGSGSGHAGGAGGWLAAGATGKSASAALLAKAAVGAVILATATVGVTHVLQPPKHSRAPLARPGAAEHRSAGAAGTVIARPGSPGRSVHVSGSTAVRPAQPGARSLALGHGGKRAGGGLSKERLPSTHRAAGSHSPARGGRRRAARVGAGKPTRHERHATVHHKSQPVAGGHEPTSRVLTTQQKPARPNEAPLVEAGGSTPTLPTPASERLREPQHSR